MAFNPFHSMRRNSKAILAVVTIFIMVIFVLSSGIAGGDFFNDFIPRLLGGKGRNSNPVYAEAFGSKIRSSDISNTITERIAANTFMTQARVLSNRRALARINQQLGIKGEVGTETVEILKPLVSGALGEDTKDAAKTRRPAAVEWQEFCVAISQPDLLMQQDPSIQQLRIQRLRFLNHEQTLAKEDKRKDLVMMQTVERIAAIEGQSILGRPQPFFPSFVPAKDGSSEDAMIFQLLLRKADELGIHYPTTVVNDLIQRDLIGLDPSDAAAVTQGMRRGGRTLSDDDIIKAIGNEYRVRAVLNSYFQGGPASMAPAEVTPNEFFDYFKDNRTETTLNLVEIPVISFLPSVAGEPTAEEQKKLYDQYKMQEFSPDREAPGFRESPKMKIEWIGTSANGVYYEKNAEVVGGLTRLAAGYLQPWGAAPAASIFQIATPSLWEPLMIRSNYDSRVNSPDRLGGWDFHYFSQPHDSSQIDRQTLAALAGQIGMAHDPFGAMVHAPLAESVFNHVANTVEARTRVAIGMPFVLSAYSPNSLGLLTALAPAAAAIPRPAPLSAYETRIAEDVRQRTLTKLFNDDIRSLREKLAKIRSEKKDGRDKKPDDIRKEADTYVQQYVKDRGLQYGKSTEFRDRYTLAEDPGLKTLRDREPPPPSPVLPNPWVRTFFEDLPQNATANTPGVLFSPHWFPLPENLNQLLRQFGLQALEFFDRPPLSPKEVGYLAWRTDYAPAKTWSKYEDAPAGVRLKVIEAWKLQKARELAKAEAERLAADLRTLAKKELQEKSNAPAFLNAVREKAPKYKMIELTKVAPLQEQLMPNAIVSQEYRPYFVSTRDIYFPGTLAKDLVDLRTKSVGETVVLSDQPKGNFYVTTMTDKKEPQFGPFATEVFAKSATRAEIDPLYSRHVQEVSSKVLFNAIDRLKIEANYKPTEDFKKVTSPKKETEDSGTES